MFYQWQVLAKPRFLCENVKTPSKQNIDSTLKNYLEISFKSED